MDQSERDYIRSFHFPNPYRDDNRCDYCHQTCPCDVIQVLDAYENGEME